MSLLIHRMLTMLIIYRELKSYLLKGKNQISLLQKKKRTVKTKNMDEMMHEMNTSMSPLKEET